MQELFEQARKIDATGGGRKQHLVPASYLARWADRDRVRVTEVETRHSYIAKPEKVGLETDFYRLEADGLDDSDLPPLALEVLFSQIEGQAKRAIDELVNGSDTTPEQRAFLAWFIAFQVTRGRAFREEIQAQAHEAVKLQYGGMSPAGMRTLMRGDGEAATDADVNEAMEAIDRIMADELLVVPQDAALAGMAAELAGELVPYLLFERQWLVYDTPPVLVTCDEPVIALAGPDGERGEAGSFAHVPIILFPLAPTKLLVLLRRDLPPETRRHLDHVEVADINRELVASSHRWVFERPSRAVGRRMPVPAPAPPLSVDDVTGDRTTPRPPSTSSEFYRFDRPTRWVNAPHTPWPVPRWWRVMGYR